MPAFMSVNMIEPRLPSSSTVARAASYCTIICTNDIGSERSMRSRRGGDSGSGGMKMRGMRMRGSSSCLCGVAQARC